jgi:hypothetical protein
MGLERRRFSYAEHIPERRCGEDRRSGMDRRSGANRRRRMDRRSLADCGSISRGERRETSNRGGEYERGVSDDRTAVLGDKGRVSREKEMSRQRRGQELQELLEH